MKYYILLVCLLFSGRLYAQQAKAYELVHYVAESGGHTYLLDYADGYLGASSIKIKRSDKITFKFQPVSGAAEENGDLTFICRSRKAGQIVLHGIDENSMAPAILKATYALKGRKISLKFTKSK